MSGIKIYDKKEKADRLKDLLNKTLKEIMSVISAECGSLFLFDSISNELVLDSFYNKGQLNLTGVRQKIGEGVSGKVVGLGTPILVKDMRRDSRFQRNGFKHYKTNSFISIPLFTAKGLLGLINLADKSTDASFSEKDLEFAVTISKYACLLIDNFHNYEELIREKEDFDRQKALLEKYASVGKLAAGVVHEINNPLDGVIRYTNILLSRIESNTVMREYLLEVKKGLNRIANITKSLLEFSHKVNSEPAQLKKYVDVHGLVDESLGVLSERINRNIRIHKRYHSSLPRILDFGLSQVIINILKNALDAMPASGKLEICTDIRDSVVAISFKDTGLGMPLEVKERIFEPFFTTKSIDKGTGLGLAISKEIINKYGGNIEVESSCGEGSTFTLLIPQKYLENA